MDLWNQLTEPGSLLTHVAQIVAAYVLALPVAWEREISTRIMGLRTFPLVAMASCSYVIVAMAAGGGSDEAAARILQGLMGGIGFIGGGALLKHGATVRGTATAASIWTTGALGAAVALGHLGIAIVLMIMNFATLRFLTPIERKTGKKDHQQADGESDDAADRED